jgi:hypothetical protein
MPTAMLVYPQKLDEGWGQIRLECFDNSLGYCSRCFSSTGIGISVRNINVTGQQHVTVDDVVNSTIKH